MAGGAVNNIKLYGNRESGHSYKVRLFLRLADIEHDYEHVDITLPLEQRSKAFQAVARFGEVPVLMHDSQVLVQSNAILLHLARYFTKFGATDEQGFDAITSWLFWEANRIGRSYPNLRYCYLFDPGADQALVGWFERTAMEDLKRLDNELSNKSFILDTFSVADISCAGYLLYGADFGFDMSNWPHVTAWLDRIKAMKGWLPPRELLI